MGRRYPENSEIESAASGGSGGVWLDVGAGKLPQGPQRYGLDGGRDASRGMRRVLPDLQPGPPAVRYVLEYFGQGARDLIKGKLGFPPLNSPPLTLS